MFNETPAAEERLVLRCLFCLRGCPIRLVPSRACFVAKDTLFDLLTIFQGPWF